MNTRQRKKELLKILANFDEELNILKLRIDDANFLADPMGVIEDIKQKNTHVLQKCSDLQKKIHELDEKIQSGNNSSSNVNELSEHVERSQKAQQESTRYNNLLEKYSEGDHRKYLLLFGRRLGASNELRKLQQQEATEAVAMEKNPNPKPGATYIKTPLLDNLRTHLTSEPDWLRKFCQQHQLTLVTPENQISSTQRIELKNTNGAIIQVTNDTVRTEDLINTSNMHHIVPAMVDLLLKSGTDKDFGCNFTSPSPEVVEFIEETLIAKLQERAKQTKENISDYRLNGRKISDILASHTLRPPSPRQPTTEPVQNNSLRRNAGG